MEQRETGRGQNTRGAEPLHSNPGDIHEVQHANGNPEQSIVDLRANDEYINSGTFENIIKTGGDGPLNAHTCRQFVE